MEFPVLLNQSEWNELKNRGYVKKPGSPVMSPNQLPKELPFKFVEQYQEQIEKNHFQPIERLRERGGLHPTELCAAMYGMDVHTYFGKEKLTMDQTVFAVNMIMLRLHEFKREVKYA